MSAVPRLDDEEHPSLIAHSAPLEARRLDPGTRHAQAGPEGTVSGTMNLRELPQLLAEQARTRQKRRVIVLPMTVKMGVAALATELHLRAADHEKVMETIGLSVPSPLRQAADRLPGAADRSVDLLLRGGELYAATVTQLAALVSSADGWSRSESRSTS